jgi:hypothetical protein
MNLSTIIQGIQTGKQLRQTHKQPVQLPGTAGAATWDSRAATINTTLCKMLEVVLTAALEILKIFLEPALHPDYQCYYNSTPQNKEVCYET